MNCRSWWRGNLLRRPDEAAKGGGRGILQAVDNACAWRGCERSIWTRQAIYVQRKFAARSPMLIPSRLSLTAWRHLRRTERFYSDLTSLATIEFTQVLTWSADFFARSQQTLESLNRFPQKSPIWNLTEIRRIRTAMLHADRQSDMTKVICTFRDY